MPPSLKLEKHVLFTGTITCLTGLRIGGTKEDIEIGGMDNPIIRNPRTGEPYIPGSSLKGKLRSVLEYRYERISANGQPCGCGRPLAECPVCTIFGPHVNTRHDLGPTRLLVRDCALRSDFTAENLVEIKSENMINRRTGVAEKPRPIERVTEGAQFGLELSLRIFRGDDESRIRGLIREGLALIEREYLGASGSRGYGKVKFEYEETDA